MWIIILPIILVLAVVIYAEINRRSAKEEAVQKQEAEIKKNPPVYDLIGVNGRLLVYEDKIILSKVAPTAYYDPTHAGDKTIPMTSIQSVQFREGVYIQFGILGGRESTKGIFGSINDENTFYISAGEQSEKAEKIKNYIESRIIELSKPKETPPQQSSAADEVLKLKQLLDMGAITQEEFEAKKKELLGL